MLYGVNPTNEYKSKDHALWEKWKKTHSSADLQALLNQMSPIINREVNKWAPSMSRSLLEAEGKRLAVEAFEKYDPTAGAALSTYLASRLQKLSRMVYSTQNTARLSETKTLLFHTYNAATNELRDMHGREPTNEELSDHLGWSPKKLEAFQRQAGRKEYIESEEHPDDENADDDLVHFIYHDLTPLQKKIFEHRTGYQGSTILSGKEIMTELNITQGQLSYQINLIEEAVKRAKGHA
jgi:DNA-directed RNA polymerase specialized sigma subunit